MNQEIIILIKIILIDLVLSADNAIVIGMTASQFNDQIRKKVLIYGTIAAVICRIVFAGATAFLLKIHGIKTFGALLLLWVVYKLYVDIIKPNEEGNEGKVQLDEKKKNTFSAAVITILVADISLSLDNVIAVAGAAGNHYGMLVFGLVLSIVLMATMANFISLYVKKYKWIGWLGLAAILWVVGDLLYQDYKYFFI
ncbi:TerC Membrane protein TerC, possibly involved in tellurium resistance [Candidatus Pelagibacterales bacterium]|jgi:YjbE family integral membrane protein